MSVRDESIRLEVLKELRRLQINKSEDSSLKNMEINTKSMAGGSGYKTGVIHRVCAELQEKT